MSIELAQALLLLFDATLALAASVHILFNKRQPLSALLWLITVWVAPFAGFVLYWYFGFNRIVERASSTGVSASKRRTQDPLDRLGLALTGLPEHGQCKVDLLEDGTGAYPVMLAEIERASRNIELSTYIFDMDRVGSLFVSALGAAAMRGVQVRVMVDGIGGWIPGNRLKARLAAQGVQFSSFWRTDHVFHQPLINLRNHRKLLIVDGAVAFTGGLNISERHHKGPLALHPIRALRKAAVESRDLHFRIRGPVIGDLQRAFEGDWKAAGGSASREKIAKPRPRGTDQVRVVSSGPDRGFERIYEMLLGALRLAKHSVDLCTPYFIPDQPLLKTLRSLALSGVRVRLFVPRRGDHNFMTWASRAYFRELIEAGVEVWRNEGTFVHTKACVIDGNWCLIGSCNLDPRSFRLNFELNLAIRSRRLAGEILRVLERYRRQSVPVTLDILRRQGFWARLRNNLVKLFSPYL